MFTHLRSIASEQICEELAAENHNTFSCPQYVANAKWVTEARQHNLVVGTLNVHKRNFLLIILKRNDYFMIDLSLSLTLLRVSGSYFVFGFGGTYSSGSGDE
jgi:hypothetical protein